MSISFTNGVIVLVESDTPGEWWNGKSWQTTKFIQAMRFGEMKSMGGVEIATEYTEPFQHDNFWYRFKIENGWGPVFIQNISTTRSREIKYFQLYPDKDENSFYKCIKASDINISK